MLASRVSFVWLVPLLVLAPTRDVFPLGPRIHASGEKPGLVRNGKILLPAKVLRDGGDEAQRPPDLEFPDLPENTVRIFHAHNETIGRLKSEAASALRDDRKRCRQKLDRAIDAARRRGTQESVDVVREQRDALDLAFEGLPRDAELAMEQLRKAEAQVNDKLDKDLAWERKQAVRRLKVEHADATRKSDESGARAIQARIDEMGALGDRIAAEKLRARIRIALVGTWDVTIKKYRAVWTFGEDGRVTSRRGSWKGKPSHDDNETTWVLQDDRVLIDWPEAKLCDSFLFPIDPAGTTGDSHLGNGKLRAVKRSQ